MAQTERNVERFGELDNAIRTEDNDDAFLAPGNQGFREWYRRLLSTLALITDGEALEYAEATVAGTSAKIAVFTDRHVVVTFVEDIEDDDQSPMATAVPRSAIRSLSVSTDMAHDGKSAALVGWPGEVYIGVQYEGQDDPVIVGGPSFDRTVPGHVGAIMPLLESLRRDLAARGTDAG
ncbi:hypothetical protein [Microbacterium sp. NPDC087589]|uniref:hypothetical protein n=1 Tax=Microbacterium sp. NPDC087589 TaxID=3364191 RepID=UPI0038293E88